MKTNEQIAIEAIQACLDATRQLSEMIENVLIQIKPGLNQEKDMQEKANLTQLFVGETRTNEKDEELDYRTDD